MSKLKSAIESEYSSSKIPLGVSLTGDKIAIIYRYQDTQSQEYKLGLSESPDGINFTEVKEGLTLEFSTGLAEKIEQCHSLFATNVLGTNYLTYTIGRGKEKSLAIATLSGDRKYVVDGLIRGVGEAGFIMPMFKVNNKLVCYFGEGEIGEAETDNLKVWNISSPLVSAREGMFDRGKLTVMGGTKNSRGLVVVYGNSSTSADKTEISCGAVIFDPSNPTKQLFRSEIPLFEQSFEKSSLNLKPIGAVFFQGKIFFYFASATGGLFIAETIDPFGLSSPNIILKRHHGNPIISPDPNRSWEYNGTFNPGAIVDDEGMIHLFYRALGSDGLSRVGYAVSDDGRNFNRSDYPVFEPSPGGYGLPAEPLGAMARYNPAVFTSGGGWGGIEDPRVVRLGDRVYMSYVAFEGWDSVRIGLTSIKMEDVKNQNWNWDWPRLISKPKEINKNWVIFPEKINGKYAILTGIVPEVYVSYVDDLDGLGFLSSPRPQGVQPGRRRFWDNRLRGAGPPPLKTDQGWLLFYHGEDRNDPGKYKLGAMLLSEDNPSKILKRSATALLSPDMWYENDGKPGVVFASGAVRRNDNLYLYYGGADRVVCMATAHLPKLLSDMQEDREIDFSLKSASL